MYYAYSTNQGATFTNCELADGGACGDAPSVTAVDFNHTPLSNLFCPGEYIDIGIDGDNVWIAYPSTEPSNPGNINQDRSVIRANKIAW